MRAVTQCHGCGGVVRIMSPATCRNGRRAGTAAAVRNDNPRSRRWRRPAQTAGGPRSTSVQTLAALRRRRMVNRPMEPVIMRTSVNGFSSTVNGDDHVFTKPMRFFVKCRKAIPTYGCIRLTCAATAPARGTSHDCCATHPTLRSGRRCVISSWGACASAVRAAGRCRAIVLGAGSSCRRELSRPSSGVRRCGSPVRTRTY